MAINIKDPEVDRMVREAAARRGQGITELVKDAVHALEAAEARARQERYERIMEATRRVQEACAQNPLPYDPHKYSEELNDDILRDNGLYDLLGETPPAPGVREEPE